MNGIDKKTHGWVGRLMDGWMDGLDGWMDGCVDV